MTIANVIIVALFGLGVESFAPAGGVTLVLLGVTVIAVRGYVIPGTPRLMHAAMRALDGLAAEPTPDPYQFEPDAELIRAGVVLEVDGELRRTAEFVSAWRGRVHSMDGHTGDADALASALGISASAVTLVWRGNVLVGLVGERPVSRWLSRAAFVADVAAMTELGVRHPSWSRLPPGVRGAMLDTLRLHLDTCPTCDGGITLDKDESRVSPGRDQVVAATCDACDARLFESGFESPLVVVDDTTGSTSLIGP